MSSYSSFFGPLLKAIVFLLFGYLFYKQVLHANELEEMKAMFNDKISKGNLLFLVTCILLMPLNWLLESLKWKRLVDQFEHISMYQSFKAIITGISVGIVTPQRIGEYGGRVLSLNPQNRLKGVMATFVCSLFQNLVNVLIGLMGFYILNEQIALIEKRWMVMMVATVVFGLLILYFLYRNTKFVKQLLENSPLPEKIKSAVYKLSYFKKLSTGMHLQVLGLSMLRYVVYLFQYILILWFFGIEIYLSQGFAGVSSIYLIQSGIPLPPILDIAARAEIAFLIWGNFSENILGILSATFGLWIINLIIPSLFGLFYVFKADIFKSS